MLYAKHRQKLETKLYTKGTDRQPNLNRKSEHPESLKRNIPFPQTLHLRRIYTADKEFQLNCIKLRKKLTERVCKEHKINESNQRTQTFDKNELLKGK